MTRPRTLCAILAPALLAAACGPPATVDGAAQAAEDAAAADARYIREHYTKREHRVPMRDGIQLFTAVYSPVDTSVAYPILMLRTPYSVAPYGEDRLREDKLGSTMLMTREKFIFVYQDVRGRFMSEGDYVNMRPQVDGPRGPTDVDESTDAYDTIEWLLAHVPNHNGKVGIWGISYPGFYAGAAAIDAHPALAAVSPQAPIADWYFDDFHHHGAFFLAHAFRFLYVFGRPRTALTTEWGERFEFPTQDGYDFFLNHVGPLANVNAKYYKDQVPFWNEVVAHPDYDEYWQARNILPHYGALGPAVMTVGGWFDAEDLYGTFKTYARLEAQNPDAHNTLVVGPWKHGGWSRTDGTSLGDVHFGADPPPSQYYLEQIELPFFEHFLKGAPAPDPVEAHAFETGTNRWRRFDAWPPRDVEARRLYLREGGALAFEPPTAAAGHDEYVSDPARPVPFTELITPLMPAEYMTADQRFASRRQDVLTYRTAPLEQGLTLAGPLRATLRVSTSGTDADWIVKLIDVYPDDHPPFPDTPAHVQLGGYQQLVRSEVLRGRYRNGYERPAPFEPGAVTEVAFELLDVLHAFEPGHRIMIQIQSTWFPLVDRNPQRYVDNIFRARPDDFIVATQRVHRSAAHASWIEVGVLPRGESK